MRNKLPLVISFILLFVSSIEAIGAPALIRSGRGPAMVDSHGRLIKNNKQSLAKIAESALTARAADAEASLAKKLDEAMPGNAYEMALQIARTKQTAHGDKTDSILPIAERIALLRKRSREREEAEEARKKAKEKEKETYISRPSYGGGYKKPAPLPPCKKPAPVKITRNASIEVRRGRGRETDLRVKLGGYRSSIKVSFPEGGFVYFDKRARRRIKEGDSFTWSKTKTVRYRGRRVIEHDGKTLLFRGYQDRRGVPGIVCIDGKRYRGVLHITFSSKGALVINEVGMEDYLRGVVGREIGPRSPAESLKAQAVIARTYAYRYLDRHKSNNADLCDSTHCQVYAGCDAECESVDKAVRSTRGYIILMDGKPIEALYHATCGGCTSNNELVFGGERKYLKRVRCDMCRDGYKYRWNYSISMDKLRSMLAKDKIYIDKEIIDVRIESASYMDRVDYVVFIGKNRTQKVKGVKIRSLLNLPSTTFVVAERKKIVKNDSKTYLSEEKRGTIEVEIERIRDAAKQYMILSDSGLRRVRMPVGGWNVINSEGGSRIEQNSASKKQVKVPEKKQEILKTLDLFGRGFGHQVGMCQSGAVEMGKQGWTYRQIIPYYYTGVSLFSLGY